MNRPSTYRMIMLGALCCALLFPIAGAAPAVAQTDPHVDTGFSDQTPPPDPDLVVVRELFYGAEGVDLTAYGIGDAPVDFVQSIYLRFFADADLETVDSFAGRITFPVGVEVIGVITDATALGGIADDGIATQTDAVFGIGGDPDAYSGPSRGFENFGDDGTSEFINVLDDLRSVVFGLNVIEGIDDCRIIIDYGDSFPADLAFDIEAYPVGVLGGAAPGTGFRVGDDGNPVVLGSGDFGEAGAVTGVPLTAVDAPNTAGPLTFVPEENIYIVRDLLGAVDTNLDGFEATRRLPAPGLARLTQADLLDPVGATDANDGLIYVLGADFGLGAIDPTDGSVTEFSLATLTGSCVDATNTLTSPDLFLLRDDGSGNPYVDRLRLDDKTFVSNILVTITMLNIEAITDTPDGTLWVFSRYGKYGAVDPLTEDVETGSVTLPIGGWEDATGADGTDIYMLRRQTTGGHRIDVFDTVTRQATFGLVSIPEFYNPIAITDGPGDLLYVIGQGVAAPAFLIAVDPTLPAIVEVHDYLHFEGTNVAITNLQPLATPVQGPRDLPAVATIEHRAAPNPFNPRVEISYELPRSVQVRVAVYDLQGRRIRTLQDGPQTSGTQSVTWDGRADDGRQLPSGTYLYRIEAGGATGTGKLVLAK